MPTGLINTAFSCLLNSVIKRQNTLGNNTFKIKEEKQKKPGTKENCCCAVSIIVFIKTFLFKEQMLLVQKKVKYFGKEFRMKIKL